MVEGLPAFPPFPQQCFLPFPKQILSISVTFILLSASALYFERSEILLFRAFLGMFGEYRPYYQVISLPNNKILDQSKLKAFANGKRKADEK